MISLLSPNSILWHLQEEVQRMMNQTAPGEQIDFPRFVALLGLEPSD
jgi:hypothetical protein